MVAAQFFPRNIYLHADQKWGLHYGLHDTDPLTHTAKSSSKENTGRKQQKRGNRSSRLCKTNDFKQASWAFIKDKEIRIV